MDTARKTEVFDQLRDLIGSGDEIPALEQLTLFLKDKNREFYREAIVHQGRLNDLRKHERRGLQSTNDIQAQRNQIRDAVLELIDEVERRLDRALLPFSTTSVDLTPPASNDLEKIVGAVSRLK